MKKVRIVISDLNGCLRGKILPRDKYEQSKSIRIARSVLAQDIEGLETDVLEEFSPIYHDRDLIVAPDESTAYETKNGDFTTVMADAKEQDGADHPVAPRTILKRAVSELASIGYEMKIASELEFYLTDEKGNIIVDAKSPYGDINSLAALDGFMDDLQNQVKSIGLDLEAMFGESGAGQFEITYGALDPLAMADKTSFFKQAVRDAAKAHGMRASFMAKLDVDNESSSQHVHVSLWKDGKQVSAEDPALLEAMVAGQVLHSHDSFSLYCPNPNSFRRYTLGQFYISWQPDYGDDNRHAAFRITGDEGNKHVENRIPGADASTHLIFAAIIFATIDGINKSLNFGSPEVVAASKEQFPLNIDDALTRFNSSDFVRSNFGEDFVTLYVGIKNAEIKRFNEQITDWERQTYGRQV